MANTTLDERVAALEAEVAAMKNQFTAETPTDAVPWWERRFGAFKDDPMYDEAMRLGREYREAQRPEYEGGDEPA